jgi:preprotein translocase subunit SecE
LQVQVLSPLLARHHPHDRTTSTTATTRPTGRGRPHTTRACGAKDLVNTVTETSTAATPERGRPEKKAKGRRDPLLKRLNRFFRQVVAELRKVNWPTRRELVTYTIVVVVFVAVMMVIIALYDLAFTEAMLRIFG